MKRFLRDNGLSLAFGLIFALSLVGQAFAGKAEFNAQRVADGVDPVTLPEYVTSSDFAVDVTENWRAIFSEDQTSGHLTITFRQLGTHAQLYRR